MNENRTEAEHGLQTIMRRTLYPYGRGDAIMSCVLDVCRSEGIVSATCSGIGGCGEVQIQAYLPGNKRLLDTDSARYAEAGIYYREHHHR